MKKIIRPASLFNYISIFTQYFQIYGPFCLSSSQSICLKYMLRCVCICVLCLYIYKTKYVHACFHVCLHTYSCTYIYACIHVCGGQRLTWGISCMNWIRISWWTIWAILLVGQVCSEIPFLPSRYWGCRYLLQLLCGCCGSEL